MDLVKALKNVVDLSIMKFSVKNLEDIAGKMDLVRQDVNDTIKILSLVLHSPLTWQKPCSLLQWVMGTAPDFQRAHCLGKSSGSGVCLDLVDFTVRVSLF